MELTYIDLINQFHMIRRAKGLGPIETALYFIILDEYNSRYWPDSLAVPTWVLMEQVDIKHKSTFFNHLNKLQQAGLIEFIKAKNQYEKMIIKINAVLINDTPLRTAPITASQQQRNSNATAPEQQRNSNFLKNALFADYRSRKDNKDIKDNKDTDIYNVAIEILDYLNEKANKKFKPTKGNLKYINARLKEKYQKEDFFKVIDLKVKQWINDPKMKQYLRPSTLFNSEKFDAYLNESLESNENTDTLFIEYPYGG
ncbi:DnaD-like replication initiation protein [Marinitoga phage MPV1]|uniref:Phage conserved hypothetical protein C-terminal domain-containing protein n=1 Tax=Marinitoga piezophila (strain DSM 14283 / JCM 11233 / KA3) TaxID=443254 RepID=H2J426_MARPK|nr:conserved phage C-terminal domain-containing protein [Marinitoga piezophila]AEX84754.1 phage conserved hypothetical protein, C-terminal domain protein [Marinitoga piezophila KA3]